MFYKSTHSLRVNNYIMNVQLARIGIAVLRAVSYRLVDCDNYYNVLLYSWVTNNNRRRRLAVVTN